jgi:hypothetical protein
MASDSSPLVEVDPGKEYRQAVVDCLREILKSAEAGELRSVHVVWQKTDGGGVTRESAGRYDYIEIIGSLEHLKQCLWGSFVGRDTDAV